MNINDLEAFGVNSTFLDMELKDPIQSRHFLFSSFNEIDLNTKSFAIFRTVISPGHASSVLLEEDSEKTKALCWKNKNLCSFLEEILHIQIDSSPLAIKVIPESGDTFIHFDGDKFCFSLMSFVELNATEEQEKLRKCTLSSEDIAKYYGKLNDEDSVKIQTGTYSK
jgi:hypothetical protein